MLAELRKHPRALLISLVIHAVVIAAMAINLQFSDESKQIKQGQIAKTVKAEIVSQEQLEALENANKLETRRKQEAEQKKKDLEAKKHADQKKKEADKKRKAEAKKKADKKRKKEAEEKRKQKQARETAEKKKAEEKRKAEQREVEEKRKAEEAKAAEEKRKVEEARLAEEERIRKQAEQRQLAEAEQKRKQADLRAKLRAEENQRRLNSLREAYILAIRQKVERNWQKPTGSGKMPICEVHVVQGPGGIILDVTFGACGGSTATYRASIENAVYRAEPLPKPGDSALFERELTFLFDPNEP